MIKRFWERKEERISRTAHFKNLMQALLLILASEVKCELIEFIADSKVDTASGTKSKYHERIIRLKEEKNRNKKKFRTSSNELEAFLLRNGTRQP